MTVATLSARHIAVEGPIGVGKTSLVELLASRFEGVKVLEDVANPFLDPFYRGRSGAAFQVQIFFLLSRHQQHLDIAQQELFSRLVVADYTMAKDRIFARLNLNDEEFRLYDRLYDVLTPGLPKPDLVIYLEGSVETCMNRIKMRGRDFERNIAPDYLQRLKEAYNAYFFRYTDSPLLLVNTDTIDFVNNSEDFANLVEQISRTRKGTQVYVPLGSGKRTETGRGTPPKPAVKTRSFERG
jgi:deoxyguanosine kinase